MRQFTLHARQKAFGLNGKRAFMTEPKGLGNKFDVAMKETATGRQLSNVKPTFEPITLIFALTLTEVPAMPIIKS